VEGLNDPTYFNRDKLEKALEMARRLYIETSV
jgi:hypothetical protein